MRPERSIVKPSVQVLLLIQLQSAIGLLVTMEEHILKQHAEVLNCAPKGIGLARVCIYRNVIGDRSTMSLAGKDIYLYCRGSTPRSSNNGIIPIHSFTILHVL